MHFIRLKTHLKRKDEIRRKPNTFNDKGRIHKHIFDTMPPDCIPVPRQLLEYKPHGRREPGCPLSIRKDNFNINSISMLLLAQLRSLLITSCILQRVIGVIPSALHYSLYKHVIYRISSVISQQENNAPNMTGASEVRSQPFPVVGKLNVSTSQVSVTIPWLQPTAGNKEEDLFYLL
jgi:hypothetical protein